MRQTKNKTSSVLMTLITFFILFLYCGVTTVPSYASADTNTNTQAQTIINESKFIVFRKGDNASYGKFLFACFYTPNTVWSADYTYNCLICPKDYIEKIGKVDDYVKAFNDRNMAVITLKGTNALPTPEGKIYKFGIVKINEFNLSRELSFIYYVEDSQGNREYMQSHNTDYNSLVARDYTNDELIIMLNQQINISSKFETIVLKIEELIESVWVYVVIALSSVVLIWSAYIGVKVVIAKKNEEKVNARDMIINLIIGIVIIFVVAMGAPLLISGLSAWVG